MPPPTMKSVPSSFHLVSLRQVALALLAVLALCAGPSLSAAEVESIFFGEFSQNRLTSMKGDGTNIALVRSPEPGIDGVAVDSLGAKVYWTNLNTGDVRRANFDGSGAESIALGQSGPAGIALDIANGHVYWSSFSGLIRRANLDGSNQITLHTSSQQPDGLALDALNGHLYFTRRQSNLITRINLDGTGATDITAHTNNLTGIAVDPIGRKIFYGTLNSPGLHRLDYDGTNYLQLAPNSGITGAVAIDLENGHVYFGGNGVSAVLRCDLDGSNLIPVATGRAGVFGIGLQTRVNRTLATTGTAAPGLAGVKFSAFSQPVANSTGRVAFTAKLSGAVTENDDSSLWSSLGAGGLALVARENGPSGVPGVNIKSWNALHLTDSLLVFRARLAGPSVTITNDDAILVWDGAALSFLAREGETAPNGGTWGTLGHPAVNDAGQVSFTAGFTISGAKGSALFRSAPGAGPISAVVEKGGSLLLDGGTVAVASFKQVNPATSGRLLATNGYVATVLKLSDGRTVLAVLAQ